MSKIIFEINDGKMLKAIKTVELSTNLKNCDLEILASQIADFLKAETFQHSSSDSPKLVKSKRKMNFF